MSNDKQDIAIAYDEWAETYDTDENRTRDLAGVVLREIGLDLKGQKVIEVGCGTGRNTVWLAERAAQVTAMDFSKAMLARAKQRVSDPRVTFIQHDAREPWPLSDEAADVVIAMLILEHVENLNIFFAEAARALTKDGVCFVCELHPIRQLAGSQAQFSNLKTGIRQRVPAFIHSTSEFVNTALAAGLTLTHLDEYEDPGSDTKSLPRLLALQLRVQKQ